MKTKLLVFAIFWIGLMSFSQNTTIPDAQFEQFLIDFGYDTPPIDGLVPTANINTITFLEIQFYNITDLTGIEDFSALEILRCNYLQLTSLDLSQNTALTWLDCIDNQLTSLDLSQNTLLTTLDCQLNQLTTLDLSQNVLLTNLNCSNNNISSLDLSQNTALTSLSCNFNQLTNLNLSQNIGLTFLNCYNNQLTNLDLNQNTLLTNINCYNNQLASLDVSQHPSLIFLYCYNNQLISLDVSGNNVLSQLSCSDNQITSLDLSQNSELAVLICENNTLNSLDFRNGNNTIINTFQTMGNPNLNCINVDDANYSTANWTDIDTQTFFSENCPPLSVDEFDASVFSMYPNPVDDLLSINFINDAYYTLINLNGQIVIQGNLTRGESTIDLSNITSGIYFLKVKTEEGIVTKKLIKQ